MIPIEPSRSRWCNSPVPDRRPRHRPGSFFSLPNSPFMKTHPRYELFEEIGRGQTAVVYRGRDMNLKIPVAVKEFRDELRSDARLFERFYRSAQSLAGLGRHDHIVLVREVDRNNGWVI